MTIRLAVFIQYQRVTDRQTDRITISISRVNSSMLTRDKNAQQKFFLTFCYDFIMVQCYFTDVMQQILSYTSTSSAGSYITSVN